MKETASWQLYMQPLKREPQRSARNQSLPLISPQEVPDRHNIIYREINYAKDEIAIVKARINLLRKENHKIQYQAVKQTTQINFTHTVRDRINSDLQHKQKFQKERNQQLQELKQRAKQLREHLHEQKTQKKKMSIDRNYMMADAQRRSRQQNEYLIQKLREIEQRKLQDKAKQVKKQEAMTASRISLFDEGRKLRAVQNHQSRILSSLTEKERTLKALEKLRKAEQQLMQKVKKTAEETSISTSSMSILNPERNFRRERSKHTIDDQMSQYEKDEFTTMTG